MPRSSSSRVSPEPFDGGDPGRESRTGSREGKRHRKKQRQWGGTKDGHYSDRLIMEREKGLPTVGVYRPIDPSPRLKSRPIHRAWEKRVRPGRVGSGLRRNPQQRRPINTNRSYVPSYVYQEPNRYQLTYLNHSGFIHSMREKRRPSSAPPSRQSPNPRRTPTPPPHRSYTPTPTNQKRHGRDDLGMIHPAEVIAPIKDDHAIVRQKSGIFNYENPYLYETTHEYRKAREYVPTKSLPVRQDPPSISKQPTQLVSVQNKKPAKPKEPQRTSNKKLKEPKPRSKEPTPRSKETPPPPQFAEEDPYFQPIDPFLVYEDPYPYQPVIPTPEIHPPQVLSNPPQQTPRTPSPPAPTPPISPKFDDGGPLDFVPNPIYTYPLMREPSPPIHPITPDPTSPPQSKYIPVKHPKTPPATQPTPNPAPQRRPPPKRTPIIRPVVIPTPIIHPTPKSKPKTPKKVPTKKYLPPDPLPPQTPPRTKNTFKPTTPRYSPPTPSPSPPPTQHIPLREFTPSPVPESRIPRARLQPPDQEPYRRPLSPPSRPVLPEINSTPPPRNRRRRRNEDEDDDDDPLEGRFKDFPPPSVGHLLPEIYGRTPDVPLYPTKTYYPSTLGLEKERLHSMGTIMRSMAMYRNRGGAGTWSFRT